MRHVTRYLLRQLTGPTLLALGALAGAIWLSQSLRFVDLIVNRGLPIDRFVFLTLLLVPSLVLVIIPVAAFIGAVAGYNRLWLDSELTICKAAGVSDWQLLRAATILGTGFAAISYAVSLYLMPVAYSHFRDLQFEIANDFSAVAVQEGVFTELTRNLTIHVRDRSPTGELLDILVDDRRDSQREITVLAEYGTLLQTDAGPMLLLREGNYQEKTVDSPVSIVYFDETTVDLTSEAPDASARRRKPRERFVQDLIFLDPDERASPDANILIAEGHERLSWPLLSLALPLVGAITVLRLSRVRGQAGMALGLGCVVAAGVVAASLFALSLAKANAALVPLLYAVPIATIILCLATPLGDALARSGRRA